MDMMNQLLNPMQTVAKPQTNDRQTANRGRGEGGDDFDALMRKKQDAAKADKSSGNEATGKKGDQQTSAGTGAKDARPKPGADGEQPDVSGDQYMMAAMMVQPQVIPMNEEALTASPEAVPQSEQLFGADGADLPVLMPEAPAERQTAENRGEILIPQSEELPTGETSGTAGHVTASDFQQLVRQISDELTKSVVRQFTQDSDEEDDETGVAFENAQGEVPVFEHLNAVPVKVAEAPVPLEAEDGIEQMGARVESLLTNENGDQTVELTLTPAELGTVRVSITHALDGALHIQMSATTARAASLLERGVISLQNQLMANNRPAVEIEIRAAENAQQQFLNPNDQQREQQQRQQNQQRRRNEQESGQTEDFLAKLRLEAL